MAIFGTVAVACLCMCVCVRALFPSTIVNGKLYEFYDEIRKLSFFFSFSLSCSVRLRNGRHKN